MRCLSRGVPVPVPELLQRAQRCSRRYESADGLYLGDNDYTGIEVHCMAVQRLFPHSVPRKLSAGQSGTGWVYRSELPVPSRFDTLTDEWGQGLPNCIDTRCEFQ